MMKTETILEEAQRIIYGDRQVSYGNCRESFGRIAKMWSAILNKEVTSKDVALCMIALKICREINKEDRDNIVDIAGYAGCIEKIINNQ